MILLKSILLKSILLKKILLKIKKNYSYLDFEKLVCPGFEKKLSINYYINYYINYLKFIYKLSINNYILITMFKNKFFVFKNYLPCIWIKH